MHLVVPECYMNKFALSLPGADIARPGIYFIMRRHGD